MALLLVGLSHRTTPLTLREKLYLAPDALQAAITTLKLPACTILSTCNRLEIYCESDTEADFETIVAFLAQSHALTPEELRPLLYSMTEQAAVQHLFRVASGLDSVILGESQILGQISAANDLARASDTSSAVLDRLFTRALRTGKRARTETSISRHTTSISHAAAALAQQQLENLAQVRTLVLGAGEMAALAVRALQGRGAQHIEIISRTFSKAQALAEQVGVQARAWDELSEAAHDAELIIAATGAPTPILDASYLQALVIDIGVPRNVDVDSLTNTRYFDIDDLQSVVDENLAQRRVCIPAVEMIVAEETSGFMNWLRAWQVAPVITDLRRYAETVAAAEVEQALQRMGEVDARAQEAVERMAHRIINKLLHEPTLRLRQNVDYADAVRDLFALGEDR